MTIFIGRMDAPPFFRPSVDDVRFEVDGSPVNLYSNEDVWMKIAEFLDTPTMVALGGASPIFRFFVKNRFEQDKDALIRPFITDGDKFRDKMRATESLISGSLALRLVDRTADWKVGDMDLYVPQHHFSSFVAYLLQIEHYDFDPDFVGNHHTWYKPGILRVTKLRRPGTKVSIDVICSQTDSAAFPLAHYYGTHVLNYISWDSFCCAYPKMTTVGQALLMPLHLIEGYIPPGRTVSCIKKYGERGFDFRYNPKQWDEERVCKGGFECPQSVRTMSDRGCLHWQFSDSEDTIIGDDGTVVEPDPYLDPFNFGVVWRIGGLPCGGRCRRSMKPIADGIDGLSATFTQGPEV